MRRILLAVAAIGVLESALAQLAPAPSSDVGYDLDPPSQTVQPAPRGSLGRKTSDRKHRVGNTDDTLGNERTIVLTVGGFVKECPTADGIVAGDFEYSLTWDDTISADDGVRKEHIERRFNAMLQGHVVDDGSVDRVELHGTVNVVHSGTFMDARAASLPVDLEFKLDSEGFPTNLRAIGDPSWDSPPEAGAGEVVSSLVAAAVFSSSTNYHSATTVWMTPNRCVESRFSPESETTSLAPGESKDVDTQLVTKEGRTPVPATFPRADEIPVSGNGTVTPERFEGEPQAEVRFNYTAPSTRRSGSGFLIEAVSRAGVARGEWKIGDPLKFQGTFTQTDSTSGAVPSLSVSMRMKVDGRLVWTPEQGDDPSPPTFGDVRSSFFRATDGEFAVDIGSDNQGVAGSSCEYHGRQTFPVASLPPRALQFLRLEIADDGRYKLTLVVPDQVLNMQAESVCKFPPRRIVRSTLDVNMIMVQIGIQEGTLSAEQDVVGQVSPPIQRGPRTITGSWSFARVRE